MRVEDIEIHVGAPPFEYEAVRRLEAKCEATTALSAAPTVDEVNGRLRALASKVGANAVINVDYKSGASLTSWKSLKATGLAVRMISDETPCEVCAETIKKAAIKCRFCGAERVPMASHTISSTADAEPRREEHQPDPNKGDGLEPLRDSNNPQIILWVAAGIFVLWLFLAAVS